MAVNVNPLRQTGEAFLEEDLVLKMEFLPEPNIPTDFNQNKNTQATLNFIRRLMEQFIGTVRVSGFEVTHVPDAPPGTGSIQVSAGAVLSKNFFINKAAPTVFSPAPASGNQVVFLRIRTQRVTFEDDPVEAGIAIPGTTVRLPSVNVYKGIADIVLLSGTSIPSNRIPGAGGVATFTRATGTWNPDELIGREMEVFDVDGNLLGPFLAIGNTTLTVTFAAGNATGGIEIADSFNVKLADVEMITEAVDGVNTTRAVVVNSIPLLPGFVANLIHQQNTDTHTEEAAFFVAGAPGTATTRRVLTTDDQVVGRKFYQITMVEHSIPASTTRFFAPGAFNDSSSSLGIENTSQGVIGIDTEYKFMTVKMPTAAATGTVVVTVRKNGVDELLSCTINTGENFCQNVSDIVEYLPLDNWAIKIENNDGSAHAVKIAIVAEITAEAVTPIQVANDFVIQGFTTSTVPPNFSGTIQAA